MSTTQPTGYLVALRDGYGVITFTRFDSKEAFDDTYRQNIFGEVVEQDITSDRGIHLSRMTPVASRIARAIAATRDAGTGKNHIDLLAHHVAEFRLMEAYA